MVDVTNAKKYQKVNPVYAIVINKNLDKIHEFVGSYYRFASYTDMQTRYNATIQLFNRKFECNTGDYLCYSNELGFFVVSKEKFEKEYVETQTKDIPPKNNYKDVVNYYGKESQARMAMEECAELIQAINKRLRYPNNDCCLDGVYEEMADVMIMLEQLKIIFNIDDVKLNKWIENKTKRIFAEIEVNEAGLLL